MRTGRPSLYKPEYCDVVIEAGKRGKSIAWMAAEIGVSKQTLYDWKAAHPAFLDAITLAQLWAQRWWEDKGQEGMEQSGFGGNVWSRSMAARFPEDWRENSKVDLTSSDGSMSPRRANDMSDDDLAAIAAQK